MSVNVAPEAKVTFVLVYEELLKRQLGVYELLLKIQPQQPVKHLQVPGLHLLLGVLLDNLLQAEGDLVPLLNPNLAEPTHTYTRLVSR